MIVVLMSCFYGHVYFSKRDHVIFIYGHWHSNIMHRLISQLPYSLLQYEPINNHKTCPKIATTSFSDCSYASRVITLSSSPFFQVEQYEFNSLMAQAIMISYNWLSALQPLTGSTLKMQTLFALASFHQVSSKKR